MQQTRRYLLTTGMASERLEKALLAEKAYRAAHHDGRVMVLAAGHVMLLTGMR